LAGLVVLGAGRLDMVGSGGMGGTAGSLHSEGPAVLWCLGLLLIPTIAL